MVGLGVLHIHQDGVVLGGPAPVGARPIVIRPDQFVQEAIAAEDLIEQHLDIVHLTVVQVHVQGAVLRQQPVRLNQARGDEAQIVIEAVLVGARLAQLGDVVQALEANPVAFPGGARTVVRARGSACVRC